MVKVGVLAIQGDFDKHLRAITEADAASNAVPVRTPEDLQSVDRLIIPGGESTTVGLLLDRYGTGEAIRNRVQSGMPVWGTCMGLIMLAKEVEDRPDQYTLNLLDVTVRRNAFGTQVHSFEDHVQMKGFGDPILGVFIRAPEVTRTGNGVQVLGSYEQRVVAVQSGPILGTSFHPELTGDRRLHRWFLSL